jgi:hypothetical protein
MNVDDDKSLDAELDALRVAPAPSLQLRRNVLLAVAREPRALSWREALAALWRELGGTRLAGPALAMALVAGLGMGWALEDTGIEDGDGSDDLIALAQLDDAYAELEP